MSLKTRFGNLRNVLDEGSNQSEILALESPLWGTQWEELIKNFKSEVTKLDCTFEKGTGKEALQAQLYRIRTEAEDAVRSGAGHIVLTDQNINENRVAMPMILRLLPFIVI